MQADLFDNPPPKYPKVPGWKEPTTSREAARKVRSRVDDLRARTFDAIAAAPLGLTADEAARRIGESVLSIRPRVTELSADGKIERSGIRRKNESGMSAAVWRAKL